MAMSNDDFKHLESIVDRLLESGLTETQLGYVNSIIRISYKHIHKSNDLIDRANRNVSVLDDKLSKLQLMYSPITTPIQ